MLSMGILKGDFQFEIFTSYVYLDYIKVAHRLAFERIPALGMGKGAHMDNLLQEGNILA